MACVKGDHDHCEEPAAWTSCRCWWNRHGMTPAQWVETRKHPQATAQAGRPSVLPVKKAAKKAAPRPEPEWETNW